MTAIITFLHICVRYLYDIMLTKALVYTVLLHSFKHHTEQETHTNNAMQKLFTKESVYTLQMYTNP